MGANTETATGIYTSNSIAVATIPEKFIRQTPLCEMADGRYPFIPEKFKISVTDKELERDLKPLFREANEVVFASDGGADAQARFFNICRHFRVGCTTSRMWLTRLCYGAIRLGLAKIMRCIDNQVVDIAIPVVYTLRTRQCFNVLRHFSSDSANLIIFRDVHAILNVKVSAIGISTLAVLPLSNLNYLVSLEISMLV